MINQNDVPRADWTDYVRLSFALAALAVFVLLCIRYDLLTRTVFWLFVPIPGVIGVIYHVLNLTPRFSNRVTTVTKYTEFLEQFDLEWSKKERSFNPMGEELRGDTLSRYTPSVSATLWGAGLLTLAYAIPAELAVKAGKIGLPLAIGPEEVQALTFAALGSYVFTLQRLISRTNSGVLTAKFLMASGLRSIIAILVGYAVGAAGIVSALPAEQTHGAIYFFIGLFPTLAMDWMRRRALSVFHPKNEPTDHLPLSMIDGITDDEISLLAELGVTEVQHLATSDPGILTINSLFPFNRVLDWIDQAYLVTYLREQIVAARNLGIRGAIDYVFVMQQLNDTNENNQDQSALTLLQLAEATGIPYDALYTLGCNLYWDYKVNLLARLWQRDQVEAVDTSDSALQHVVRMSDAASGELMIRLQHQRVTAELRRQAANDAARFRAENPDAAAPDSSWLATNYKVALKSAQAVAAVGTQPQPRAQFQDVYQKEVLLHVK